MISARLLGCPLCGWARGLRASRLSTADCIVARCPCGGWEVHGGHSLGTHSVPPVEHRWLDGDQIDHTVGTPMPALWMVRTERRAGEMTKIDILRGSFGCADSTGHVAVGPYRREVAAGAQWHDCARGDGGSYSGVVETLERAEGESEQAFEARAFGRAREIGMVVAMGGAVGGAAVVVDHAPDGTARLVYEREDGALLAGDAARGWDRADEDEVARYSAAEPWNA